MNVFRFFRVEPISLSAREQFVAALACFIAILTTGWVSQAFTFNQQLALLASMGASSVVLFITPGSPMAQPWPFVGGQLISAFIGCSVLNAVDNPVWAAAIAAGLSVIAMLGLRCLHPPGVATALSPVVSGAQVPVSYDFLGIPVGVNVLVMLVLALIINRLVLRREYPASPLETLPAGKTTKLPKNLPGISQQDLAEATREINSFVDAGGEELLQMLTRLQLKSYQKHAGALCCGDLMQEDIVTVGYADEVETVWQLMHDQHFKVLPVLDSYRYVIGIVTLHDFFKNLELTPYRTFQQRWLTFIKRTPDVTTNKPEAIGHIMTRKVKTLPASAPVSELFPLVINEGHHHVPIVNEAGQFVGMVFQNRLLAVLFNQVSSSKLQFT